MTFPSNSPSNNAINNFLLNTKAKTTKSIQRLKLKCFCRFTFENDDIFSADWSKISRESILLFTDYKIETVQFNTVNNYLNVLKVFARECLYSEAISQSTYNSIRDIKKYNGHSVDKGRALHLKEVNKVKSYFSDVKNSIELRNYAIFSLAIGCGLRRAEISSLNIEHINDRKLQVKGKGNKGRTSYLSDFTFNAVMAWRKQLPQKQGALFVHIRNGDNIKKDRLGIKGVHYVIREIQKTCKLSHFTTHDLRRTFATTLLHGNTDIFTVQDLLGHSDPITTKRYDKRDEQGKIMAINSLPF